MEAGSVPVIPDSHPTPGLQALSSLVTCVCDTARGSSRIHWVTDEHEHDGPRVSNGAVLNHLFEIAHTK